MFLCLCEGVFSLGVPVDSLFFIGSQLVATSHTGKVGVWNAVTQHWQVKQCFQCYTTFKHYQGSYLITSFAMQHLYRCRMWCPSRAATLLAPSSCWAVTTAQFTILVSCLSSPGLHWIYFYMTWVINEMCNRLYQSQCWKCNYNCIKASM